MKAIVRYGQAFGGYTMRDVPEPTCGPEDIILEIKAAAICGADMKHWRVDNGSRLNSTQSVDMSLQERSFRLEKK
mgnify:CR=1 FL=1